MGTKKNQKGKSAAALDPARVPEEELTENGGLFRVFFLLRTERFRMFIGSLAAFAMGSIMPGFSIVFGQTFNVFFDEEGDDMKRKIGYIALAFAGLGVASFILGYVQVAAWSIVGENLSTRLRFLTFQAIVNQEIAYFDTHRTGDIMSRVTTEVSTVQTAIGEKVSMLIMNFSQALGGIAIAFYYGWKMTLVLLALMPLLVFGSAIQMVMVAEGAKSSAAAYATANSMANEVISNFRTVASFVREDYFVQKYDESLKEANKSKKKNHIIGIGFGFSWLCIFATYSVGFWYGGTLVANDEMKVGDLLIVFFSVVMGGTGLGQAGQLSPDFAKAKQAARVIFTIIDRKPKFVNGTEKLPPGFRSRIEVKNLTFCYPTRPDAKVLKKISFTVEPGTTVALVGSSGSGKSTIVSLIERFYDPISGSITIDGVDIRSLECSHLREQIGLVAQEPVLCVDTLSLIHI
eukprot:TRINITY_DN7455_c0_g1_i1.p1 TRINITY_DN7455_c0_g1~~TRINITY_DN7455_c0_g1_i1.p1  ORF type:complete len:461 (+),score=75.23 TRINITY_DN7455_c0_g1_i1:79-1461(+)